LAEIAIGYHNDDTGKDEVEVIIINLTGKYEPPPLIPLRISPVPSPVGAPAITGNIIKLISGDVANEGEANNYYDFIVLTDEMVAAAGNNNVYIYQNYTVAGATRGLNYRCVASFLADVSLNTQDAVVDADLTDADHDGLMELAVALNTTTASGTTGNILIYDLELGGAVIGELPALRFTVGCEIVDIQPVDLRRDNMLPDDIVLITKPCPSLGNHTVHLLETNGTRYTNICTVPLGEDMQAARAGVGEFFAFSPTIQQIRHEDFVFATETGQIRFYVNNWGRTDMPPLDQVPSLYGDFMLDLPGTITAFKCCDMEAPGDYDDVMITLDPDDPAGDQVYQIKTSVGPTVELRESGEWQRNIMQALPGYMDNGPIMDLVFSDQGTDTINIVLRSSEDPYNWSSGINETRNYPGDITHFVVTQHQNGRPHDIPLPAPPPTITPTPTNSPLPTLTPTATLTPTVTVTPTGTLTPLATATGTVTPLQTGTPTPEPSATPDASGCVHDGDVNGDGTLTPGDSQLAFYYYLDCAGYAPTDEQYCAADFCDTGEVTACDGSVTPGDSQGIMKAYLGYEFPCQTGKAALAAASCSAAT